MYSFLLAIIYLAFISLGLPDSLLGAAWPVIHLEFDVPVSYMGIITMVISGATIISSLFSDKLTKALTTKYVTIGSVFITVIALYGFSVCKSFFMLIVLSIPYGIGAGAIDAALNNYVALHYKSRHMSWLHCFWGLGAIISPFIMGYAITSSSWECGYLTVSLIQLGIGILLLITMFAWKANSTSDAQHSKSISLISALKIKGVPYILIGFFAYCAAEATTMYWASTFFSEAKGISPEASANLASLFYIGLTVARFACGFITDKLGDRKMIIFGTCVLTLGIALLFLPTVSNLTALAAFIVIGIGCAPVYPCIIHSTPSNFGEQNSGAIIGIQMASAYVGSTFIPPLFGLLARRIGFEIMPLFLLFFVCLMITMIEATFRSTKQSHSEN